LVVLACRAGFIWRKTMQNIVALFDIPADAEAAIGDLELAGFARSDFSVVVGQRPHGTEPSSHTTSMGAAVGAGVGILAGLATIALPGVGLVLALGPLIAGGVVGAVAGGLVGSLADMGVPALEARNYEEAVRRGGTLLSFAVEDQDQIRAMDIIRKHHPVDIKERALAWHEEGWNAESAMEPPQAEEVEAVPTPTSSMGTMAAPSAQPTREVNR
jgi:uncharacterized membrane protein